MRKNTVKSISCKVCVALVAFVLQITCYAQPLKGYYGADVETQTETQLSPYYVENYKQPTFLTMTTDLVIVRPLTFAATLIGVGLFIVSLPFTAASQSVGMAADTLVVTPARTTFLRCLGCV